MRRAYMGYSDTVYVDTLVQQKLAILGGDPTIMDLLSVHGPFSILKPLLFVFAITYAFLPLLIGYLWCVTRPSVWVYQYQWAWLAINFIGLVSYRVNSDWTAIRQKHIDEYGTDLRCFWPRIWWYTLPFNTIILIYASNA